MEQPDIWIFMGSVVVLTGLLLAGHYALKSRKLREIGDVINGDRFEKDVESFSQFLKSVEHTELYTDLVEKYPDFHDVWVNNFKTLFVADDGSISLESTTDYHRHWLADFILIYFTWFIANHEGSYVFLTSTTLNDALKIYGKLVHFVEDPTVKTLIDVETIRR